jgi:hypothetical protein
MSITSTGLGDEGRRGEQGERRGILGSQWDGRDAFTVEETGKILGLSRASAFAAANRGDIPTIRIGKRLIVPRRALERMLGADEADASVGGAAGPADRCRAGRPCPSAGRSGHPGAAARAPPPRPPAEGQADRAGAGLRL